MGYIYALLIVSKNFGMEKIPRSHIQQICETVLTSGENLARKRNFTEKTPLMYEWYQEYYVGAAHGLAGIYYYLMQVRDDDGESRVCFLTILTRVGRPVFPRCFMILFQPRHHCPGNYLV